ncbi:MORN repeat-containing protein [Insectomime virus]|nr:MORN repeat-containing protein [Insectomime virus]
MEEFLVGSHRSKRQILSFALATGIPPKKENHIKFFRSKHRSFWRLPNGKKHGPEETYWEDGSIKTSRMWENGKLHGLETLYDVGGERVRIRTNWKDGKFHGKRSIISLTSEIEQFWEEGILAHAKS